MAFRLINATTLVLENTGPAIPPYAILSHTWETEEITHQEMSDINGQSSHPATQKSGYLKIRGACQEALSRDLYYVWVDTCCIDQTSSADLSEAINSMFSWYRRAQVCFAYLSDLPPNVHADMFLPQCRWFERGWTLQELLAPSTVLFYNNKWKYIGSKSSASLRGLLSRITRIDEASLNNVGRLPALPIAQKMSWASYRKTTKPEDIAYSLMGIFGVNMPLLYGEGQENAFTRLQEEIIKKSNDLSIFAWVHRDEQPHPIADMPDESETTFATDPDLCCDLLAKSPDDFAGCGNILFRDEHAPRNLAFSITNNGLLLSRVKLILDYDQNCYLVPLNCYVGTTPTQNCYLPLKMIDNGLFITLRHTRRRSWYGTYEGLPPPAYVITRITPSLRRFAAFSHRNSIQIRSPAIYKSALHESIQEACPRDSWDAARLAFLCDDEQPVAGHCKFSGTSLALAHYYEGPDVEDFYLVWGDLHLSVGGDGRERLWVRLCRQDDWKRSVWTSRGRGADSLDELSQWENHRLRLEHLVFEAVVNRAESRGSTIFRIDICVSIHSAQATSMG